jgi:hypothetical protein
MNLFKSDNKNVAISVTQEEAKNLSYLLRAALDLYSPGPEIYMHIPEEAAEQLRDEFESAITTGIANMPKINLLYLDIYLNETKSATKQIGSSFLIGVSFNDVFEPIRQDADRIRYDVFGPDEQLNIG